MIDHSRENITLEDAMSAMYPIKVWFTSEVLLQCDSLPEAAEVLETYVVNIPNNRWQVGVRWRTDGNESSNVKRIREFSALKDVQSHFPFLSKVKGTLLAFYSDFVR